MSESFDPLAASPIILPVRVFGSRGSQTVSCALDTGASQTVLPARILRRLGVNFAHPVGGGRLYSATGSARVTLVRVPAVLALGRVQTELVVASHDMPIGLDADGLLGLDFFRRFVLRIDFVRGRIDLDLPRRWWQVWRAA